MRGVCARHHRRMRPSPLPFGTPRGFTVRDARANSVRARRLRSVDLVRPFHGTRARAPLADLERLQLLLRVLPERAFACGITAAAVHQMPLAATSEAEAWRRPRIGVPLETQRIRRPEVVGHRLLVEDGDVVEIDGIAVLSAARTWIELSVHLSLERLVAVTDAVIAGPGQAASLDELHKAHERFTGGRGSRLRRRALELCDEAAESPPESMVRVILVESGLPRPECNVEIRDGSRFVARVDMLYRDAKLVIEYDGDYHRDPDQWSRDQIRRANLEALGYRVTVVTRRDFDDPAALVARIRRLLLQR